MAETNRRLTDPEGGQAVVEFIIVFPLWLLMTLGIMQMGLMYGARQVVHYAAFCAARAELVKGDTDEDEPDPSKAATIACIPVMGRTFYGGITMPSFKGKYSDMNSTLDYILECFMRQLLLGSKVETTTSADKRKITSEVKLDFELQIPIVNRIFVTWYSLGVGGMTEGGGITDYLQMDLTNYIKTMLYGNNPHCVIKEKTAISRPWADNDDYKDEKQ